MSIVYYTPDTACASIDNAANEVTILEGAACSEVRVNVNVTINGMAFFGSDVARIVRLSTLTTTASAYPAGSSLGAAADLLPLPCDAGFEQFRLFTQGTLSTNTIRTISPSIVAYASTNTVAAVRQGSDLVVAATGGSDGSAAFGSTAAEFESGWTTWNSDGVTINAFTATVYRTYDDTLYNYGASTWNSVPGGAKTAAAVALSLIHI